MLSNLIAVPVIVFVEKILHLVSDFRYCGFQMLFFQSALSIPGFLLLNVDMLLLLQLLAKSVNGLLKKEYF